MKSIIIFPTEYDANREVERMLEIECIDVRVLPCLMPEHELADSQGVVWIIASSVRGKTVYLRDNKEFI